MCKFRGGNRGDGLDPTCDNIATRAMQTVEWSAACTMRLAHYHLLLLHLVCISYLRALLAPPQCTACSGGLGGPRGTRQLLLALAGRLCGRLMRQVKREAPPPAIKRRLWPQRFVTLICAANGVPATMPPGVRLMAECFCDLHCLTRMGRVCVRLLLAPTVSSARYCILQLQIRD